jgi:hypothetical protein
VEPFDLWHSAVKFYQGVGIPQSIWERFAKMSFLLWQSAVKGPRNLAKDWIPAPAILHREPPCLLRHTFLPRDF